jgi:16S rRNA (cytidine1402-2'-O)-methyltransferase
MAGRDGEVGTTARRRERCPGTLYVVATPIGNLEDITLRALRVLREVDLVAAEDTRRTRILLEHHGIRARLVAYHDHVESERAGELVRRLLAGESIALVSDAGTPLIADPGYRLLRAAVDAGIAVVPIPGPSAPIALLSCAALPTDRFTFVGFLPSRRSPRRKLLLDLVERPETLLFLETPRRLGAALADLAEVLGERPAVIGRELTKRFEQVRRGTLGELATAFAGAAAAGDAEETSGDEQAPRVRGEIVLAVAGASQPAGRGEPASRASDLDAFLRERLERGDSVAAAARAAAHELGVARRDAYLRASSVKRSM